MVDFVDILLSGGASGAGRASDNILERLAQRRRDAGFTPGINPNAPSPVPPSLSTLAGQGNFGTPAPTSRVSDARVQNAADPTTRPSLRSELLGRLGAPGRALMPVSAFLDRFVDRARDSASRGGLTALAPEFARGVREADANDLNRRFIEAQIQNLTGVQGSGPSPLTALGKAKADFDNGFISQEVFDAQVHDATRQSIDTGDPQTQAAKIIDDIRNNRITQSQGDQLLQEELDAGRQTRFDMEKALRGEFRGDIAGPRASLSGLAAAESLLANNNAISDTAAFTSFIRSIDNSVVRPAEQDAYNKALGLRNQIEATVQQWAGKGPLPPATKQALLDSVRKLRTTMEGITDRTVDFYNKRANKFSIDPEGVTGIPVKFEQQDVPIDTEDNGSNSNEVLDQINAAIEAASQELQRRNGN
jgi:hypothetical protein